ncbi:hypothetical protein PC119_g19038 [Phytophthora cactorum]|nr:hypothetical protein PC119_g19038 [Phytophthora cactorum]
MMAVLGVDALNTEKFTKWDTRQCVLGLEFGSVTEQVSMPAAKIVKARRIVSDAYFSPTMSRKVYQSLMGSLRDVATCIQAAHPFLANVGVTCIAFRLFQ